MKTVLSCGHRIYFLAVQAIHLLRTAHNARQFVEQGSGSNRSSTPCRAKLDCIDSKIAFCNTFPAERQPAGLVK